MKKIYCDHENHNKSKIKMVCFNPHCNQKLMCLQCIRDDEHIAHHVDNQPIKKLHQFFSERNDGLKGIIEVFESQIQMILLQYQKIIYGLDQKLHIDEKRFLILNNAQISDAIQQIIEFNSNESEFRKEIINGFSHFHEWLQTIYSSLKIDTLTYRKVNEEEKKMAESIYNQSCQLFQKNNYEKSLAKIEESLHLNPYDYNAIFLKGDCLKQLKRFEEAVHCLTQAQKINEKHLQTLQCKGECLKLMARYEEAKMFLKNSLKIHPGNTNMLFNIGDCLY